LIRSAISKRYAKALLGIGQEDGKYEAYGNSLKDFVGFCGANDEFFRVVANQIFSVEERKRVLDLVLGGSGFAPIIQNFLRLLLDKNRIGAVKEISEHYGKLTDDLTGITRAQVMTAWPMKDQAVLKIKKALEGISTGEVKIEVKDDAALIGGIVVKIGDLVLDGSVRAQLEGLKESLKRGEYS
jgi:F-type H+-transporting ATPase subunit delta